MELIDERILKLEQKTKELEKKIYALSCIMATFQGVDVPEEGKAFCDDYLKELQKLKQ